jgi:hypothetical protein
MVMKVKLLAICMIAAMEGVGMVMGVNGDTLIYSIAAIAALGGAESVETLRGKAA